MKLENYIEHTLLKPEASSKDLKKLYDEAVQHSFYGVCINGRNVKTAKEYLLFRRKTNVCRPPSQTLPLEGGGQGGGDKNNHELTAGVIKDADVKVITVIGFPLGACTSETKAFEAGEALKNGADEIDMVINIQALKDKDYEYVQKDIEAVKKECGSKVLKVIIETDLITKDEIVKACGIIEAAKADFAKTSTGFVKNGKGAQIEDIKLMADALKETGVKIKASGGIKTREQALALINAGASRLGTSSGVSIING